MSWMKKDKSIPMVLDEACGFFSRFLLAPRPKDLEVLQQLLNRDMRADHGPAPRVRFCLCVLQQ